MKFPKLAKRVKKPKSFDSAPAMKAGGVAYIVKLTMSTKMNKTMYVCNNEQLIFSDALVPNEQILELQAVKEFLERNPDGLVEKCTFECELKTVRNEIVKGGEQNDTDK